MNLPPQPNNIGKQRTITGIDGIKVKIVIEDEIVRPQESAKHTKLIYSQKLRIDEERLEYRLTYYMLGLKPGARGRWVFGQYSLMIPAEDLAPILAEAHSRGWPGI